MKREKAIEVICIEGKDAALGFFTRHPHLGLAIAINLQCELSASLELLREYRENHRRHIDFNTRCTPEGRVEAYPIICDLCKKADQLLGVEGV